MKILTKIQDTFNTWFDSLQEPLRFIVFLLVITPFILGLSWINVVISSTPLTILGLIYIVPFLIILVGRMRLKLK